MAKYIVEVTTGEWKYAGTIDNILITLFGTHGQSEQTELDNFGIDFTTGQTSSYTLKTGTTLGKLLLLRIEKTAALPLPEDEWFCSKVVVTTPEGEAILFPCYRWVSRGECVELRGGRAMKIFEDNHSLLTDHRKKQLMSKKNMYKWKRGQFGVPHYISLTRSELPDEYQFSKVRSSEINHTKMMSGLELLIKGLVGSTKKWENIEAMTKIFWLNKTTMSEFVKENWKRDEFFGYQFLNGINPNVIKRLSVLPPNFPVTEEMVKPFLENGSSLEQEMKKGNIFLYDQKKMEGISPRMNNSKRLHITPGLCLFYLDTENKLMPIAIQLQQQPSDQNPIFLPSDSETDWLLARMFIKNVDSLDHQVVHHLLNTHLLAEVFNIATVRSLPEIHPIYKLLTPHFLYTLHINIAAREILLGPDGVLSKCSLGLEGIAELMGKSHAETTYSSLCLPDNITARGLESIPNFYYRDDGLKLWSIINSFVTGMIEYYYPSDCEVCKDSELQEWIQEIFTHGFLGNKSSGIPECFHTVQEVIKFITMVIFTVSVQHPAVNNGQFDFYSFAPNASLLLHNEPPSTKGKTNLETILQALPNRDETTKFVAMAWLLSNKYSDSVPLGTYPEVQFDEPVPKQIIEEFQVNLSNLSKAITVRNSQIELPYTYLDPAGLENSINI